MYEHFCIVIIQVDCTANTETCSKYGVSGYPTLKIFRSGEFAEEYQGPREEGKLLCSFGHATSTSVPNRNKTF